MDTGTSGVGVRSGAAAPPATAAAAASGASSSCFTHVATLEGHTDRVWDVSWSPAGDQLASCSGDSTVRLVRTRVSVRAQCAPLGSGHHPLRTPLGLTLGYGHARQWRRHADSRAWECAQVLEHVHQRTVRCCSFSPCGRYLATASFDATTAIWEQGEDGELMCIATLEGHENEVKCVSWAASGALLATCSRDKTVWIWAGDGTLPPACPPAPLPQRRRCAVACLHELVNELGGAPTHWLAAPRSGG
jgi:WD40 repeat protein